MPNFFDGLVPSADEERFDTVLEHGGVRFERIVSLGQASPPGFWYDQAQDEWVILLQGEAVLRFEDADADLPLHAGDWVFIAAHRRHRVVQTSATAPCVWLAVHWTSPSTVA